VNIALVIVYVLLRRRQITPREIDHNSGRLLWQALSVANKPQKEPCVMGQFARLVMCY